MSDRDPLLDRFFERQRREILARLERRRLRRRPRSALAAMAVAAAALLAVGLALISSAPPDRTDSAWLWELPLSVDDLDSDADLLAAFDPWDGARPGEEAVLPPLADEAEPVLDPIPDVRL